MSNTRRSPKCQLCKINEAEWAMQFIGEDKPTFSFLGSHYRGFAVTKVCDECKERELGKYQQVTV